MSWPTWSRGIGKLMVSAWKVTLVLNVVTKLITCSPLFCSLFFMQKTKQSLLYLFKVTCNSKGYHMRQCVNWIKLKSYKKYISYLIKHTLNMSLMSSFKNWKHDIFYEKVLKQRKIETKPTKYLFVDFSWKTTYLLITLDKLLLQIVH